MATAQQRRLPMYKRIIDDNKKKWMIKEYLNIALTRNRYVDSIIQRTTLGTRIVIIAEKKNRIIGRKGQQVKALADLLKSKFNLDNVVIDVIQEPHPEYNARLVALRIADAMAKGIRFRRAAIIALRQLQEANVQGAEVIISGKLTTERSRFEKYSTGIIIKAGQDALEKVQEAVIPVLLKPGIYSVRVRVLPPDAKLSDRFEVKSPEEVQVKQIESKPEGNSEGKEGGESAGQAQ
ncbi:30S ribosomal protein S3 [Caldivirga sp. UBA161]|uniref:30S ribosomal protein S3 n=1 Tax=Caldivirga sp. UBA161 TaxID=1915569 RepID=UPI0025C01960|nr:30S ribosomal protein S3 [Caldivirga sp. UBA161]